MKALSKKGRVEAIVGFSLFGLIVILGLFGVLGGGNFTTFLRCLIGIGFGYALTRGDFGFAGMANKTCRKGSTKLIRNIMLTIAIAAVVWGALMISDKITVAAWIKPISWGLLIGGILFGVGMAFSSCCATGTLQDVPVGFWRALMTMLFFGVGVFLGTPFWKSGLASTSLITDGTANGVYFGNLFINWFGASAEVAVILTVLLTIAIAVGIAFLFKAVERKIAPNFPTPEVEVEEPAETVYEKAFVQKWKPGTTALVIVGLFSALVVLTSTGWGASTVYGTWFASFLNNVLGIDEAALLEFLGPNSNFTSASLNINLLTDPGTLQNLGIVFGAFLALLLAGKLGDVFKAGLKIKPIELVLFALGGLLMGFGTRLSWGCNVGAFFTPAVQGSLAAWLYFFIILGGGYLGNKVFKWFYATLVK